MSAYNIMVIYIYCIHTVVRRQTLKNSEGTSKLPLIRSTLNAFGENGYG